MAVFALLVSLLMGGGAATTDATTATSPTAPAPLDVGGMPGGH